MPRVSTRPGSAVGACLALLIALAGCNAAAAPSPSSVSPSPAGPSPAAPTPAGPTSFAEWTARQGFGGSSGLGIIRDNLLFVVNRPSDVRDYDVDADEADITHLADWLDLHPATACWADYHATVREALRTLADGYEQMRPDVHIGHPVPEQTALRLEQLADDLINMPPPANCP